MTQPAIDVLSVMQDAIERCNWIPHMSAALEARDAVSELIEAARESLNAVGDDELYAAHERLRLALARCTKEESK